MIIPTLPEKFQALAVRGDCGVYAMALAEIIKERTGKAPLIGFFTNANEGEIKNIDDIIYGDFNVDHIIVKYDDYMYDAEGLISEDDIFDYYYGRTISWFKYGDKKIETAIGQNTNWTHNIDYYKKKLCELPRPKGQGFCK